MYIMGIDTSCDDTCVAIVKDGTEISSNVVSSQVDIHKEWGGVVPEIASRSHAEAINAILDIALQKAGLDFPNIDGITVTFGPGLPGALRVGINAGSAIALALNKPLIGVNHVEAHIFANLLVDPDLKPPFLALVISGGHTELIYVSEWGDYQVVGRTRDDACGEAYDKVAKLIGLGYPGGPIIDELAHRGNQGAIEFPHAKMKDHGLDFSFSGIKTAVLNYVKKKQKKTGDQNWPGQESDKADLAASFQRAMVNMLIENTVRAARESNTKRLVLGGGVASNRGLRENLNELKEHLGVEVYIPPPELCTDNAAMVAELGWWRLSGQKYKLSTNSVLDFEAHPNLSLSVK